MILVRGGGRKECRNNQIGRERGQKANRKGR